MRSTNSIFFFFLIVGMIVLTDCRYTPELDRQEAEKALKVLDSDMTRWLDHINQSEAGRALHALLAFDSAPFPVRFPRSFMQRRPALYQFKEYTGTWTWDQNLGSFTHTSGIDRIIIEYPLPDHTDNDATCIIYQYREEATTSAHSFPVLMVADIFVENKKVFTLEHQAVIEQNLPVFMETSITMGEGFLKCSMENRLDTLNNRGEVTATITAGTLGKPVVDGTIQATIKTFSGGSYGIRVFKSEFKLFDCLLVTDINYFKINPTSREYVKDFNKHAKIQLYIADPRQKIGEIILKEKFDYKKLDFAIRFSDLSDDFLSNYLLVFNRILEVKSSK
ncbi:MAG: hypothetical protein HQ542_10155 [Bacteroidia bacterium]|nr:hypothetical protein [Bacteroidia bacterium]